MGGSPQSHEQGRPIILNRRAFLTLKTSPRGKCQLCAAEDAGVVAELERQTAINEDVIRWLTVRVDEHEGGPSVQMRKNDRERTRRREREEM